MCAATWGIVYTSVGNQSQVTDTNVKAAESNNAERALLLKERARSVDMLEEERKALAKECSSGNGTRCSGKTVTVGTYENAVIGIDTKLARIGPEVPVAVKADKMASLIAALCDKDQSIVKRFLLLIEPFTYSLIFEVCALVSFSFGFSHRRNTQPAQAEKTTVSEWHTHQVKIPQPSIPQEQVPQPQDPQPEVPQNPITQKHKTTSHKRTRPSYVCVIVLFAGAW
jgi:hypothetical protein